MPFSEAFQRSVGDINKLTITNTAEVIAMVIIETGGAPLGLDAIGVAAMQSFPLFAARIAKEAATIDAISPHLRCALMTALRSYDFEFYRLYFPATFYRGDIRFNLNESAARFILRDHLYPLVENFTDPTPRAELLHGLPDEMKLLIFGYVLHFPKSRIVIDVDTLKTQETKYRGVMQAAPKALVFLSRDRDNEQDLSAWSFFHGSIVRCPRDYGAETFTAPMGRMFDLLRVDKTTRAICQDIIYDQNCFHANSLEDWSELLQACAHTNGRTAYPRHVSMSMVPYEVHYAEEVFTTMKKMGVESVGISLQGADWHGFPAYSRKKPLNYRKGQLEMVKGLEALLRMGSEVEVWIEGDWEEFAVWLRRKSQVKEVRYKGKVVTKK